MRIQQLSLDFFGRFVGHTFDFGKVEKPSDFHIIYGPNEAGKTTTMEGFLRLLYGFPHREPYDYQHHRKNLRVSGVLELDDETRSFTRLPTRIGNLLDEAGSALPENALAAHLGGLTIEDYRSLLCLDDDTIEKGGEDIANARGDIGRLLFSAAAGVADLNAVLEETRTEAEHLYRKRASTTRMAQFKKELAEIEHQIREHDITASAWHKLKQTLQMAKGEETAAKSARDTMRARQAEVTALRRALPLLGERDRLEEQVAPFADYPNRLDLNPEVLVELKTDQGKAEADFARLREEITKAEEERAGINLNVDQLPLIQALDALDELRSRTSTAELDLPRRRQALQDAEADMYRTARDLGAPEGANPTNFVVSPVEITALEESRDTMREAIRARDAEAREVTALEKRVTEATEALASAQFEAPAQTGFSDLLARFDADNLAPAFAAAREAMATAEERLADALSSLDHGGKSYPTLPHCPIDVATTELLASEHAELTEHLQQTEEALARHREDMEVQERQMAGLTASAGVASDADALEAQADRDALWQAHRAALTKATADAFEPAMARVDELAANRLAHARELGQLRQLEQARIESETRVNQANTRLSTLKDAANRIESQTEEATRALGLPTMMPATLHAWIQRHAAAAEALRHRDRLNEQHQPVLDKANRLRDALCGLLPLEDPDFNSALAAARRFAKDEHEHQDHIKSADSTLKSLEKDLARRKSDLASLAEAAERAVASFTALVSELFGGLLDWKAVDAALGSLRELREHEAKRVQAARQVSAMEADQREFAEAVIALAMQHDMPKSDPLDAFDMLRRLAEQASAARARHDGLTAEINAKTEALDAVGRRLEDIARQVRDLGALFPETAASDTLDALRTTVATAQDIIAARTRIAELEQQILSDLSAPGLDTARTLLEGATAPALAAEAETLQVDLDVAEARLSEATAARAAAARDLAVITGDAEIAALVERRMTLELQIEETALDYLERDFGLRLAEEAIRRYRDTHRSGMMLATERAFVELTNGTYTRLHTQPDGASEILLAIDASGSAKQVGDMSKGTRFQLYLALRAAAYEQLVSQGIRLPFFCDDIFETFDEDRTRAACRLMERIGRSGQAIYLTHHRHVIEIAREVCAVPPTVHNLS